MRIRLGPWDWLALGMVAMQAIASGYIFKRGLEGVLPMIFDMRGEVLRWGDRQDVGFLLAVTAGLTLIAHLILNLVAAWAGRRELDPNIVPMMRMVVFVSIGIVAALLAAIGLGGFYWSGAPQA